jgi:hypothetical protein
MELTQRYNNIFTHINSYFDSLLSSAPEARGEVKRSSSLMTFSTSVFSLVLAVNIFTRGSTGIAMFAAEYICAFVVLSCVLIIYLSLVHSMSSLMGMVPISTAGGTSNGLLVKAGFDMWPFHLLVPFSILSAALGGSLILFTAALVFTLILVKVNLISSVGSNYGAGKLRAILLYISPFIFLIFVPVVVLSLFILLIFYA